MSAGDKQVYLQPGQKGLPVRAGGDFIFLKEAVRPVRVLVDGQPIVMTPGAKQRIQRKEAGKLAFDDFEVDNLSDELPMSVTFVVGVGDYDQMIISGEVVSENVLRGANGDLRPNTKQAQEIALFPNKMGVDVYDRGEIIEQGALRDSNRLRDDYMFNGPNDEVWVAYARSGRAADVYRYTREMQEIGLYRAGVSVDSSDSSINDVCMGYMPGHGLVTLTGASPNIPTEKRRAIFSKETGEQLFKLPYVGSGIGFDFVSNRVLAFTPMGGGYLEFYDVVDGKKLAGIDTDNTSQLPNVSYNQATNEVWVTSSGGGAVEAYNATTFEKVYSESSSGWPSSQTGQGIATKGPIGWALYSFGNPILGGIATFRKISMKDATIKQSFYGVEKIQQARAYFQKTKTTMSAAQFDVVETPEGPEITGEIIRLTLESYYGRRVANDYMDHVYAVQMGRDGMGFPTLNQGGGNRSLELMGVDDHFTIVVPSVVTIEHDSELQLEGFI